MSVDTIKKLLLDTEHMPDNTPVRIGETEVPLSSLRQLSAAERSQLADAIKANEERATKLEADRSKVVDLARKAQEAYTAAEEARAKAGTPAAAAAGADPFDDPWLSPVKKALADRDAKLQATEAQLKQLLNTVTQAATIFAEDRWDREFASVDFGKREKKPTRDELLKFATDNKLLDRHGFPSIRAAWDKMSEADRLEAIKQEALERGREEGRMAALANRIPAPGVPGPGQAPAMPRAVNPNTDVLGDLYQETIKDPELRALLEQLPAGMA